MPLRYQTCRAKAEHHNSFSFFTLCRSRTVHKFLPSPSTLSPELHNHAQKLSLLIAGPEPPIARFVDAPSGPMQSVIRRNSYHSRGLVLTVPIHAVGTKKNLLTQPCHPGHRHYSVPRHSRRMLDATHVVVARSQARHGAGNCATLCRHSAWGCAACRSPNRDAGSSVSRGGNVCGPDLE